MSDEPTGAAIGPWLRVGFADLDIAQAPIAFLVPH
jgi:hypothetical protein